ncbi:MAG: hypothetical protein IJ862_04155 [Selenomonadaceae bacterium]|nr:hypothetical protein [Selenomonadaceae bacterium]
MANSLNTITVDGITYNAEQYAKDHPTTKVNDELGKEVFLQLLVAQMKYQDPLDPQDNSEYVAELANFSALEQMTNVASNLESLSDIVSNIDTSVLVGQLSSMVGKGVNWTTTSTTQAADGTITSSSNTFSGIIQGVSLSSGTPTVIAVANGVTYRVSISDIDNVFEVQDAVEQSTSDTTVAGTASTNTATTDTTTAAATANATTNDIASAASSAVASALANAATSTGASTDTDTGAASATVAVNASAGSGNLTTENISNITSETLTVPATV